MVYCTVGNDVYCCDTIGCIGFHRVKDRSEEGLRVGSNGLAVPYIPPTLLR